MGVAIGLGVGLGVKGVGVGVTGVGVGVGAGVGVGVWPDPAAKDMHAENSDVSPVDMSLAVAVALAPTNTAAGIVAENVPCPEPSVVAEVEPRNWAPSPYPEASHPVLAKNSTVYCSDAQESSVPWIVTDEPVVVADSSTGKFCNPLPPSSTSPGSFSVTPPFPPKLPENKSIPSAPES